MPSKTNPSLNRLPLNWRRYRELEGLPSFIKFGKRSIVEIGRSVSRINSKEFCFVFWNERQIENCFTGWKKVCKMKDGTYQKLNKEINKRKERRWS